MAGRPSEVVVGPYRFRLVFDAEAVDAENDDPKVTLFGTVLERSGMILVRDDVPERSIRETLLHELLHACYIVTGNPLHYRTPTGVDGEELAVASLSPTLLQTLRANPDVASYLFS